MSEISNADVKETKPQNIENFKNIKPEKEMTTKELNNAVSDEFEKAANEVKTGELNNTENATAEKNVDPSHKDCLTTSEERKELANRSKGEWDGEPGDSKFYPEKQEARDALDRYEQDGINYKDGEPDFSKSSI